MQLFSFLHSSAFGLHFYIEHPDSGGNMQKAITVITPLLFLIIITIIITIVNAA